MPSNHKIQQAMENEGIPEEILMQFDFTESKGGDPMPVLAVIEKMDRLLTKEQRLAVMEQQGCCKGGQRDKDCKAFGKANKGKTIAEKLALMFQVENMMQPKLNEDGSFTVVMSGYQNGRHKGKTTCSCSMIKKLKQPFSVSATYCGCCAGHFRYHYQNMLGVQLRLKEINASPLDTNGEEPCSFTFAIDGLEEDVV